MNELPRGWTLTSIEGLAGRDGVVTDGDWVESKDQDPTGEVRLIQLADVGDGIFVNKSSRFMNMEAARRLRCTFLERGDVLVARMPDPLGRACIFPGLQGPAVTAVDVFIWRPGRDGADANWLMHTTNSPSVREALASLAGGTTRQRVSGGNIKRLQVPTPPLAEQRRIAVRIEALFARTRRARADLERIAPLAKRYVEQSRRRAFGEDAPWPTASLDRSFPNYTPPRRFDRLRDLPHGWRWAEMSSLGDIVGGITKNQKRANQPLQMPYLRVANVYADELRLADVTTIQVTGAELERVRLRDGDLLIVEGNGSVEQIGRVAVWNGSIENCGHQNHLIRVRPAEGVPPRFILHWLMSPYGRSILETVASSSSGLHTLSLSKIGAVPVPLAPAVVADIVVEALDRRVHSARSMQADTVRALTLLDRLEQSILARAFRGELVPQVAADKVVAPAEVQQGTLLAARRGRRAA